MTLVLESTKMEKEKPYTKEEMAKTEESRIMSDAERIKGGGKIEVDEKGNRTNLLLTQEQIRDADKEAPKTSDDEFLLLQKRKELEILESESAVMQQKYNSEKNPEVRRELRKQWDGIIEKKHEKLDEIKRILPIMIIYRENDLFDKYMPQIKQILSDLKGREINMQSFPREADKYDEDEEIIQWYNNHRNELKDLLIISDYTASVPWELELKKDLKSKGVLNDKILDEILNEASNRSILGNDKYEEIFVSDKKFSEKESQALIMRVAEKIFENKENIPNNVYIFLDNILDHSFVDHEARKIEEKEKLKKIKIAEAEKIKKCLIQAGLEPGKIVIMQQELVPYGDNQEVKEFLTGAGAGKPNNWFIIDRHGGYKKFFEDFENAIKLNLPAGNFFGDAKDKGFIPEVKPEDFPTALKTALEKRFGKK